MNQSTNNQSKGTKRSIDQLIGNIKNPDVWNEIKDQNLALKITMDQVKRRETELRIKSDELHSKVEDIIKKQEQADNESDSDSDSDSDDGTESVETNNLPTTSNEIVATNNLPTTSNEIVEESNEPAVKKQRTGNESAITLIEKPTDVLNCPIVKSIQTVFADLNRSYVDHCNKLNKVNMEIERLTEEDNEPELPDMHGCLFDTLPNGGNAARIIRLLNHAVLTTRKNYVHRKLFHTKSKRSIIQNQMEEISSSLNAFHTIIRDLEVVEARTLQNLFEDTTDMFGKKKNHSIYELSVECFNRSKGISASNMKTQEQIQKVIESRVEALKPYLKY